MVFSGPAERLEKPVGAFKNFFRTAKPFAGEQSGYHAAMGCPTGMHSFCPGTISQIFDDTRALTATDSKRIAPLTQLKAIQFSRGRSSAEGRTQCSRMEAARVEFSGSDNPDFAHDFGASNGCFQNRSAIRANLLADRQSCHPGAATGVHDGFFQRVIVIQAVRQCSISKHGVGSSNLAVATDQSAVRRPPESLRNSRYHSAELHCRRGQRHANRIEKDQLGFIDEGLGNIVYAQAADKSSYGLRVRLHLCSLLCCRLACINRGDIFFRAFELASARINGFKVLSFDSRATRSMTRPALSAGTARLAHSLNFSANSLQLMGFSGWPRATSYRPSMLRPS